MDESLSKYAYLGVKTKNLLNSNIDVALIYFGSDTKENFYLLKSLINTKYKRDHLIVNVLDTHLHKPSVTDGTVLNVFVDDSQSPKVGTKHEWQGWDESWHNALSQVLRSNSKIHLKK